MSRMGEDRMLKKYLSVLIIALILLSCFAMPCVAANIEVALETLAYDTFLRSNPEVLTDDYKGGTAGGTDIAASYVADENGNDKIPGYGWSTNWVVANSTGDGYTAPASSDNIKFTRDTAHSSKYYNHMIVNPLSTKVYRFLKNPITFAGKDGKYIFSVDISLCVTNTFNGIRYYIGDAFYIGFEGAVSGKNDNTGTVTPLIGVNGKEFKSDISLWTGSVYSDREFVTYTVTVELNADGEDTITLSAVDGENMLDATYEPDTVATVSTTAELSGTCEYIAFESADSNNPAKVCLYGFNISGGSYSVESGNDIYPVSLIAEETIAPEDYANGRNVNGGAGVNDANIVGAYTDASVATGTGWSGNWVVKDSDDTDYRAPADEDKVHYLHDSDTSGQVVFLRGMPAGTNLYRLLEKSINFNNTNGKYIFSADIKNGFSASKSNLRFKIGENLAVGYNAASATDGKLVIEAGDKTYTASGNIALGPVTTDATYNYYMHFDVEVSLNEAGADVVKLSVTKRGMYNTTEAGEEPTSLVVTADLNGSVDYIGFGSITGATAQYKVDNISVSGISGEEMEKLARIEVQNGEFKSGDGLKLLDTSKITDSVLYGFNLFNYFKTEKKADVFMGVYYGGKLAGIKTLSVTVPAKSKSDTLSLGFADGLPDGDKTDISVKVLVWEKDTFVPYTDRIDMYSQSDRAVIPEVFGKDAEGQTIVAFMGDSITHLNPSYTKWIEYYYRIKYPTKDIKFVSKGISGDSAGGNLSRFDWDIYSGAGTGTPTEACLMIGMNDVNRSLYPDGSEENKQTAIDNCLANIEAIADECAEKGIKLTLITPTLYDEADYTSVACNTGVNAGLGKIAERVIKLANEKNLAYIDFYGYINSFNSALRSDSEFAKSTLFNLHADRIHATPAGTFAEGFIFIDQQINDSVIASVDIDASELDVVTESATVTDIANENGILSYTYLPASLPMYMTDEYTLCNDTYGIPVTDSINREIIKVSGLEDGNYKIMFDDAEIGIYTAAQLAEGVNIATAATNPGYVKSQEVYDLVSQKMAKDYVLREIAFVERWLYSAGIDLTNVQACINYVENTVKNGSNYESNKTRVDNYANYKTNQATTIEEIEELEDQAKQAAQPENIYVQIIKKE